MGEGQSGSGTGTAGPKSGDPGASFTDSAAPLIETPRLALRPVSSADAGFILELLNEPAFIENIGDRGVRTTDDALAYISVKLAQSYRAHGYGLYVVESRQGGAPMGICGFVKRDVLEHADIGFSFLHRFWSRGYAHEAAAAVMDYGRSALGFGRVFGITAPKNLGSIRLLGKLGLKFERTIQMPGTDGPRLLYSVTLGPTEAAALEIPGLPPPPAGYTERMPHYSECQELQPVGRDTAGREAFLAPGAARAWLSMREDAGRSGVELLLISAFRSIERQRAIVDARLARGESWAEILRVSAYPGFSEHHSGRAVDIGAQGCGDLLEQFEGTREFSWLVLNAGRFGFSLTYPRDSPSGIAYEPWHWCYSENGRAPGVDP